MNREFKRDLNNNYMILSEEGLEKQDDYRIYMLTSNQITCMLPCTIRKFDGDAKYYYEITSKHPINRIYEKKKLHVEEIIKLVSCFMKAIESSCEYLLNPDDFILEPEYIYMDLETTQVYFCYLPGYQKDVGKSFHALTSYLLEKIDHEDKHTVATTYELYRQTMTDNYSLKDILKALTKDDEYKEIVKVEKEKVSIQPQPIEIEIPKVEKHESKIDSAKEKKRPMKYKVIVGGIVIASALLLLSYFLYVNLDVISSISFDQDLIYKCAGIALILLVIIIYSIYKKSLVKKDKEQDHLIMMEEEKQSQVFEFEKKEENISVQTDFFEKASNKAEHEKEDELQYGNTVLLNYRPKNHKLVSTNGQYESFELTEIAFMIGKMKEHVDGVIKDDSISRIHAEIRKNKDTYFLTDLNSTNGTFYNNRRLEANETVELHPQDAIRFADIEYVFQ